MKRDLYFLRITASLMLISFSIEAFSLDEQKEDTILSNYTKLDKVIKYVSLTLRKWSLKEKDRSALCPILSLLLIINFNYQRFRLNSIVSEF